MKTGPCSICAKNTRETLRLDLGTYRIECDTIKTGHVLKIEGVPCIVELWFCGVCKKHALQELLNNIPSTSDFILSRIT